MEQNNELKTKLISEYVEKHSQDYIDMQIDSEKTILNVFEQLINEVQKPSIEYTNAKNEYNKQCKVVDYFCSDEFKTLYKNMYKEKMQILTLEEVEYITMQQNIVCKVNSINKDIAEIVCDIAENVAGEHKLHA